MIAPTPDFTFWTVLQKAKEAIDLFGEKTLQTIRQQLQEQRDRHIKKGELDAANQLNKLIEQLFAHQERTFALSLAITGRVQSNYQETNLSLATGVQSVDTHRTTWEAIDGEKTEVYNLLLEEIVVLYERRARVTDLLLDHEKTLTRSQRKEINTILDVLDKTIAFTREQRERVAHTPHQARLIAVPSDRPQ